MRQKQALPPICPGCRKPIAEARSTDFDDQAPPRAGDIGLCTGCGQVMLFTAPNVVRLPTEQELAEAARDLDLCHAIQALIDAGTVSIP
jgi:hypothetical protein